MTRQSIKTLLAFVFTLCAFAVTAQTNKQKGLLWQVTGNGLKKPSYVYGTMHVSQKIAFHLGDSFYLALSKSDVVALEQDLDSVIHRWITESDFDNPEDAEKVYPRSDYQYLSLYNFTLSSYNKELIERKLSAEVREVNYLLQRGEQDDFEEDAWLDLYIYQIAKKLGKGFTGVEGYEESRDLVKKSQKEPKDSKKKKPRKYNYKLRQQIAESYRKGDIYMIDSIDRMTESEHYLEYMLYKRNANMVRRMDSIMRLGKTMFTGVGCSHLPGTKGVLQMLIDKGYKVRPVQSIALEKSKMAKKYEDMKLKHTYSTYSSEDGLISASLPTRLTKVNDNSFYSSYLSPDLANGYYYQIEKLTCNTIFSGKTPEDILLVIDTMIFENIPGEIRSKRPIFSNGFEGMEVVTELKTGDLNRFHILASPFNVYIIRLSGKKDFALSSDANNFFKTIQIREGNASTWRKINSPDSVFSLELPSNDKAEKLTAPYKADPSFEHLVYEKNSGHTYLVKQEDLLNQSYLEEDTFELLVMAESFAKTDDFKILSKKHFNWQGYYAMDAEFENKNADKLMARFVICGTRYIMFLMKPNGEGGDFNDRFFTSVKFNGKPSHQFFEYKDTSLFYKVQTPVMPILTKKAPSYSYYYGGDDEEEDDKKENKYIGNYKEVYYKTPNANEFITVSYYKYGYYENQNRNKKDYYKNWEKTGSLKLLSKETGNRKGVDYTIFTYSDTNTTRQIKVMHMLHGQIKYNVEAYLDTVSGKSDFVNTFFNTFDVSDTLIYDDIFKSKGDRFFADFTSKDSATRKAAIKNFNQVTFTKHDVKNLCNAIDTINMKADAAELRLSMLSSLSYMDSAQDVIVPYLQKLYNRFSDTAYMQIEIVKALAHQRSDKAFLALKPILANDIPISNNEYEMTEMLYAFYDSLKLTKTILPELIELTSIQEYRNTAYAMISKLKDSSIINENDYASIHNKLVNETKIEYKRMMASINNDEKENSYNYNYFGRDIETESIQSYGRRRYGRGSYYNNEYSLLGDILDLSLPLRSKNKSMQELVTKILKITDNDKRLSLLPVLLKYNIHYEDSVYQTLAKSEKTRSRFYTILAEAKQTSKFPKAYMNHNDWVKAEINKNLYDEDKLDTIIFIENRKIVLGKDSGVVYVCKYQLEESDEWTLYISDALPCDTNSLPDPKKSTLLMGQSINLEEGIVIEKTISEYFFENLLMYTRNRNGGYYDNYSSYGSYDYGYDF